MSPPVSLQPNLKNWSLIEEKPLASAAQAIASSSQAIEYRCLRLQKVA